MKIAVLSGKGGTGKTTVSTSLAFLSKNLLIDTDVEAPNSHLFLKCDDVKKTPVYTYYPVVDMEKCTLCKACGDFCRYNAIIPGKNKVIVFEESCHYCGGCEIVCRFGAISWGKREIGNILEGTTYFGSPMKYGRLNIGEMSGVKIIKELYKNECSKDMIIDCPPGSSCSTVASLEGVDFAIVVTESTPFGLSDMKLVISLLRDLHIPFGVVINKKSNDEVEKWCNKENIEVLGEIPFDREIAKRYSNGEIVADALVEYQGVFENILKKVKEYGN